MTDKELLELAAKAAGYSYKNETLRNDGTEFEYEGWNPLLDDGDALRLAVLLQLLVDVDGTTCTTTTNGKPDNDQCELHSNSDPYEATRRAIVRAAAEIGRSLKS